MQDCHRVLHFCSCIVLFFLSCDKDLSFILFTFWTVHGEIKSRLHSGKTWYYLVKNLSSNSISKNVKGNVCRSTCCTVSCGTWYRTLREEPKLRVWRTGYWERCLGIRRREWHDTEENYSVSSFTRQILSRWLNHVRWNWQGIGTQRRNAYRVLVGKDDGKRQFERPRNRREDNIKLILFK